MSEKVTPQPGDVWKRGCDCMFASTGGMSTDKMPTVDEILAKSQDLIRKGQQHDLEFMQAASIAGIEVEPSDDLRGGKMVLQVSREAFERLRRSAVPALG